MDEWNLLPPVLAVDPEVTVQSEQPRLLTEAYSVARVFDASERVASYPQLPGRGYLRFDQKFIVFKRNKGTASDKVGDKDSNLKL